MKRLGIGIVAFNLFLLGLWVGRERWDKLPWNGVALLCGIYIVLVAPSPETEGGER